MCLHTLLITTSDAGIGICNQVPQQIFIYGIIKIAFFITGLFLCSHRSLLCEFCAECFAK